MFRNYFGHLIQIRIVAGSESQPFFIPNLGTKLSPDPLGFAVSLLLV